jgi:hypothetical protein
MIYLCLWQGIITLFVIDIWLVIWNKLLLMGLLVGLLVAFEFRQVVLDKQFLAVHAVSALIYVLN